MKLQNEKLQMAFVAFATAIAGEFKITPFGGSEFRVALGSVAFLLMLRLTTHLSYIRTGLMTGAIVLLFRLAKDEIFSRRAITMPESLHHHFPSIIYYLLFAVLMSRIRVGLNEFNPLRVSAFVSAVDFIANGAELLVRVGLGTAMLPQLNQWIFLLLLAVVRSYFVIGLYSSISVSHLKLIHTEQKKRMEQMLSIGSGLYGETLYLRKSLDAIEQITASAFLLYQRLKNAGMKDESAEALRIAQQFHEVKKDSQRILAGLLKLFARETVVEMPLSEIMEHTVQANEKYSEMLGKEISFQAQAEIDYPTLHYIPLLTVLGNLTANAVEAIEQEGWVRLQITQEDGLTVFMISNNGPEIPEQERKLIFEPGFTTKYNQEGAASTGIGLSHVRDIVQSLHGELDVMSTNEITTFRAYFPTKALRKEE